MVDLPPLIPTTMFKIFSELLKRTIINFAFNQKKKSKCHLTATDSIAKSNNPFFLFIKNTKKPRHFLQRNRFVRYIRRKQ